MVTFIGARVVWALWENDGLIPIDDWLILASWILYGLAAFFLEFPKKKWPTIWIAMILATISIGLAGGSLVFALCNTNYTRLYAPDFNFFKAIVVVVRFVTELYQVVSKDSRLIRDATKFLMELKGADPERSDGPDVNDDEETEE